MGLDVTAYSKLVPAPGVDMDDADAWESHVDIYPHSGFPGREAPFSRGVYSYDEKFGFRAGSYGGYNLWREWLASLAGYPPGDERRHAHSEGAWAATGGPFWELINFADNEGTIGTTAAAKLAADFAEWEERAVTNAVGRHDQDGDWFIDRYRDWRKAFELAADGGAVDFH